MLLRCCSAILSAAIIALATPSVNAQHDMEESTVKVAMRMIGHQVLLSLGDSSSRVLPIEKEANGYRIRFESEFGFDPDSLVSTIKLMMDRTGMAESYLVEVNQCETQDLVYSYQVAPLPENSMIACNERVQPVGCYSLFITILDKKNAAMVAESERKAPSIPVWAAVALIAIILPFYWFKNRRKNSDPNLISIGNFLFDKHTMELISGRDRTELTSKEAELLLLLYASANETVVREMILKEVWGDEGDYIGRTLDVFISKLRKKLEADPSVKILNVRGVGYKLVID